MENNAEQQPVKLSKNAFTPPKIWQIYLPIILIAASSPIFLLATNHATGAIFYIPLFFPLAILGMITSRSLGLSLSKMNYDAIRQGKITVVRQKIGLCYLATLLCSMLVQVLLYGSFPIQQCWATCQVVSPLEQVGINLVVIGILLIPAFIGINHYKNWVIRYNLPKPAISNEHQDNRS